MGNNEFFHEGYTVNEQIRHNNRIIKRLVRHLKRYNASLERGEKKLSNEIINLVVRNQLEGAKLLAKDLVDTIINKKKIDKIYEQINISSDSISNCSSLEELSCKWNDLEKAMKLICNKVDLKEEIKLIKLLFIREDCKCCFDIDPLLGLIDSLNINLDNINKEELYNNILVETGIKEYDGNV